MPEKGDSIATNGAAVNGDSLGSGAGDGSADKADVKINGSLIDKDASSNASTDSLHSLPNTDAPDSKVNTAKPKHINGRRESSKKFRIQSVNKEDDPLYNKDDSAPGTPDTSEERRDKAATFRLGSVTESEGVASPDRELRFGEVCYCCFTFLF